MEKMTIEQKLSKIQVELKVNKSKYNSFGKYYYRSAEDIEEALKEYNVKYNVNFTIRETLLSNNPIIIQSEATIQCNESKEKISVPTIVGVDLAQKGMQVAQAFGSASSYGKKYALGNLLLIDDTQDADATNTHGANQPQTMTTETKYLNPNTNEWVSAIEYLKGGGTIDNITKKYRLSAQNRQLLLDSAM